mmetsp:Transcript_47522/g.54988  ORF Transcript_47522/g.54988 Transcript_47522/m.54988 type:complete len:165 (+) Transcript_47522:214-708(+)
MKEESDQISTLHKSSGKDTRHVVLAEGGNGGRSVGCPATEAAEVCLDRPAQPAAPFMLLQRLESLTHPPSIVHGVVEGSVERVVEGGPSSGCNGLIEDTQTNTSETSVASSSRFGCGDAGLTNTISSDADTRASAKANEDRQRLRSQQDDKGTKSWSEGGDAAS